jgi:hypothetical protein
MMDGSGEEVYYLPGGVLHFTALLTSAWFINPYS